MGQLRDALRRAGSCAAALALIGSSATWLAPAATAVSIRSVTMDGTDSGDCSGSPCRTIQYAVQQANSGDTISIGAGTYSQSVRVRISLTIVGAGASNTIVTGTDGDALNIDGSDVTSTPIVAASGIAFSNSPAGAGIELFKAQLTLTDAVVSGNYGAGVTGYVPDSSFPLSITDSTIANNGGPGVYLSDGSPDVTIQRSTINGNELGGVQVGGGTTRIEDSTLDHNVDDAIDVTYGTVTVRRSTISNTTDDGSDGSFAGGFVAEGGTTTIETSTIANNAGRGVLATNDAAVTVTASTIAGTVSGADNSDAAFGGLVTAEGAVTFARSRATAAAAPRGPLSVTGSIVAGNTTTPDCSGTIDDGGYNLSSDAANSCGFSAANHDLIKTDAKLGALQDNGGPTKTMKPAGSSPAIDEIPNKTSSCVDDFPTDQRGTGRPIGSACDIGAVETPAAVTPPPPPPTCPPLVIDTTALPDGTVGTPYSVQLKASGGCDSDYSWIVPSEAPEGGFPSAGTQTTAPAGEQSAAARPALDITHPVFTPTVHRSPVAAPTSAAAATGSPGSDEPAGNTAPPGLSLDANGVLSGTPTQAGTFTFTVSVNDPVLTTLVLHVAAAATGTPTATATTPAPSTSHGVGGVSTTAGAPVTATLPAGGGPLANTGASTGQQLRLALTLLVAGGALVLAGARHRRRPRQH